MGPTQGRGGAERPPQVCPVSCRAFSPLQHAPIYPAGAVKRASRAYVSVWQLICQSLILGTLPTSHPHPHLPVTHQRTQAKQQIADLIEKFNKLTPTARQELTESSLVHQFINPLLEALGWPMRDTARVKYELSTHVGRPDIVLLPEKGGAVYVEAKRLGLIQQLKEDRNSIEGIVTPGDLSLPGMAADRTKEEQQAINYAFSNGGQWAILTNFEKLRLFNARRDWLVLSFERPHAYLDKFDLLWQLSYESIREGALDRLSNLRHREDVDTDYLRFINEWRERLARDIIHQYQTYGRNQWAFHADGRIHFGRLRSAVQRILDRLVVVRFAEDHLIIPVNTLSRLIDLREENPYTFELTEFLHKLFRRFDAIHNSMLFAPSDADEAYLSDEVVEGLLKKLYEARYRAMTPDIMGNTYEQYLGKALVYKNGQVTTADNLETRKKQGSYYTPQVIVRYLVDNALGRYLYATRNGRPEGEPLPASEETPKTWAQIRHLRVIDPACGSGSFLIYAYELLADFYRREIARLEREREEKLADLTARGVRSPFDLRLETAGYTADIEQLQNYPTYILENHLYGLDLDPQAAEIATVNLMMRAMADQPREQKRLPLILNQNVKVGNGLIGTGPQDPALLAFPAQLAEITRLRQQLVGEGNDHTETVAELEAAIANLTAALDQERIAPHFLEELTAVRPFHWLAEFPEVFVDGQGHSLGSAAGFDVVLGNPPWEIIKPDLREYYAQFDERLESKLNRAQAEKRIAELNELEPDIEAGWQAQQVRIGQMGAYFKQTADFTQQGKGDTATHKLFVERGYQLLRSNGRLAFVIPSGIYADLGTKELRMMLLQEGRLDFLYNFSNERFFFAAVHHSFKFTLLGAQKGVQGDGFWATFRFNPRVAVSPDNLTAFLDNQQNLIYVHVDSLAKFSPDSLSVLEFQERQDYAIASKLYGENPLIGDDVPDTWNIDFAREFDMSNDSKLFNQTQDGFPLYEGKMIHQYDAFFTSPRYWVNASLGKNKLANSNQALWHTGYRFAFRAIASSTNERTCIATVLPPDNFTSHSMWVGTTPNPKSTLFFVALFNSYCVDWLARFFVNFNVTLFVVKQLPLPRLTAGNPHFEAIVPRAAQLSCPTAAFAPLWEAVMGRPWSLDQVATEPLHRQQLRNELDAIVAHLYGLSEAELAHILATFPLVPDAVKEGVIHAYRTYATNGVL